MSAVIWAAATKRQDARYWDKLGLTQTLDQNSDLCGDFNEDVWDTLMSSSGIRSYIWYVEAPTQVDFNIGSVLNDNIDVLDDSFNYNATLSYH